MVYLHWARVFHSCRGEVTTGQLLGSLRKSEFNCNDLSDLYGLVPGGGHDLPVVGGEGHGEDVLGVVLKPAGRLPGTQIPQSETFVPGAREREVAIRG